MLQPEAVIIQSQSDGFADGEQYQYINKKCECIALAPGMPGQVPQPCGPPSEQQHNQQSQAKQELAHAYPPPNLVVFAGLGRIRGCDIAGGSHYPDYGTPRKRTRGTKRAQVELSPR